MSARRLGFDWQAWGLWAALLAGMLLELLIPGTPLSTFLMIPMLASAGLGRPALTASMAVVSLVFAIPAQRWLGYDGGDIVRRSVLMASAGVVGWAVAVALARTTRARAAALAELGDSESLLRAVSDSMLEPQFLVQPVRDAAGQVIDFTYRSANRAFCSYRGWEERDVVGTSLLHAQPNLVETGLFERYVHCLDTGESVVLDKFGLFNAMLGEHRYFDIRVVRAGGDLLSVTFGDVTDRHQAAQRIAASEQRYRLLAENATDVVVHVRDGTVVWASPSVREVLGAPDTYWIGRQIREVSPTEEAPHFARRMATLASGGTVADRIRVVSLDGVTHWVSMRARPFTDDAGNQDGFLATLRVTDDEVAAEQQAEEARRRQARADALYRRAVDGAAVGMCLADLEGNFIEANPALCEFFGYGADTLQRMTWQELTDPEYLEADLDNRAKVMAGDIESYRMVKRFIHADGHPIWGDLAVSCIRDEAGQVELFIGQIADITDEVEAREDLEEARALLAASADSMLDPQVLFQAVREGGRIVDFTYIGVNRATCLYLQVDETELLGTSAMESLPNLEESGLLARYAQCVETGEPVILTDFSYFNEMLDDARRYDIRATRAGADLLSLTWTDVTERYQAAQQLQEASDLLRASSDAMLDPHAVVEVITDSTGNTVDLVYRDANTAFCDLFGVSRTDVLDQSAQATKPNLAPSGLLALYAHCSTTGEPVELEDFEYALDPAVGPRRWDIRVARVRPGLLTGTFRDVTERFTAAQRVAESEEQYRLLAINSTDAVVHVRDGVVVWASPSMEAVLGAPPEHWVGEDMRVAVPPEDLPAFEKRSARIDAGESVQERIRVIAADGVVHWAHLRAGPFYDDQMRRDGATASVRLIDAEVRQEEEARRLAVRLDAEMASAKDYVTSILPEDLHGEVEITSRYMPAMDLGGDGFHWRWLDDDHLKIYLIDVSGHGIRPALLSVSVHNLIRSGSLPISTLLNPDRLLNKINRDFQMEDQGDSYFTIWYGVYQKSTRTLRYASAGHPPALALGLDGGTVTATPLSTPSTPIGMFEDAAYGTDCYTVPPGGQLLLYSDGAYEFTNNTTAGNPMMSHMAFANLCTAVAATPDWSLDLLVNQLKALSPDGEFDDDCALVLATFH